MENIGERERRSTWNAIIQEIPPAGRAYQEFLWSIHRCEEKRFPVTDGRWAPRPACREFERVRGRIAKCCQKLCHLRIGVFCLFLAIFIFEMIFGNSKYRETCGGLARCFLFWLARRKEIGARNRGTAGASCKALPADRVTPPHPSWRASAVSQFQRPDQV